MKERGQKKEKAPLLFPARDINKEKSHGFSQHEAQKLL